MLLWGGVRSRVVGVRKADDLRLVLHPDDPVPPPGTAVRGALDDERRTALMRTHTAVHVLAGVVTRDLGVRFTGGDMTPLAARVDLDLPDPPPDLKDRLTEALRAEVAADRAVVVSALPRADAYALGDITRTATDLVPPDLEVVRLVDVVGLDLQADGGTHVATTALVGEVSVRKVENKGRGFRRVRLQLA